MNKTKLQQFDELMETQIWIDFNKVKPVADYLEAIWEDDLRFYNKETLLEEMKYFSDSIADDQFCWIADMLDRNPKKVYKLRNQVKYYINKWEGK